MNHLFEDFTLKGKRAPNRLMLPPMLTRRDDKELNGRADAGHVAHYGARARGGAGLVVVECTAIAPKARLGRGELGLWEDGQIEGMAAIAQAVKAAGSLCFVQLHHAGFKAAATVTDDLTAPSDCEREGRKARTLRAEEIETIIGQFVAAARRARAAGMDGVELHGCHEYLLNEFTSPTYNTRTDAYAGYALPLKVLRAVKAALPEDFIVGYRMGVNDNDFDAGVKLARALEQAGADYLSVSAGLGPVPESVPEDFGYNWFVYGASLVHAAVKVPVVAVNSIRTPEQAQGVIARDLADIVAVGRAFLADENFGARARAGEPVNPCYGCPGGCNWLKGRDCPALLMAKRKEKDHV